MPVITKQENSPEKELFLNLIDPRNYAKAAEKAAGGFVKGVTLGAVDPVNEVITNPVTGEKTQSEFIGAIAKYASPLGLISRFAEVLQMPEAGLEKELEQSKFAEGVGHLIGLGAPIGAIEKVIATPLVKSVGLKGAKKALTSAAVTGGTFGFLKTPEDSEAPMLDQRVKNAVTDSIIFPAFTGTFLGARGLIRAIRGRGKLPVKTTDIQSSPEVDTAGQILTEKPPPVREVEIPIVSRAEIKSRLDRLMQLAGPQRRAAMKQVFPEPQFTDDMVLSMLKTRESLPKDMRAILPQGVDDYPFNFKIPVKRIEKPANQIEHLQRNALKYSDAYTHGKARRHVEAVADLTQADAKGKVLALEAERDADIITQLNDTNRFIQQNRGVGFFGRRFGVSSKRRISDQLAEDITFFREKTGNPYIEGDTFAKLSQRVKRQGGVEVSNKIGERLEAMRTAINEAGIGQDVKFLENYIAHRWDVGFGQAKKLANRFVTKTPFANPRAYRTFEEGMRKAGLKPLTTDAFELLAFYEGTNARVLANNRMINRLKGTFSQDGDQLIMSASKAPESYITVRDAPALNNVKVHPEIAREMRVIFQQPFDLAAIKGLETINSVTKFNMLSFSLFHHMALTESSIAALGFKGLRPIKSAKEGLKLLRSQAFTRDMARHGVQLGPLSDVQLTTARRFYKRLENSTRNIKGVKGFTKNLRVFFDRNNEVLWDYYHTGLKANAYHRLLSEALKRSPHIDKDVMGREIARHVNNAFGGQNWNRLLADPRMLQVAHWGMLAPDWTLSQLRIAGDVFRGGKLSRLFKVFGEKIPASAGEQEAQKIIRQFGRRYFRNAVIAGFAGMNLLNYAFTSYRKGLGKGHFIWDNDIGNQLSVESPYMDDEGRKIYIKPGKQVREVFRWLTEPHKVFGAKLSPLVQISTEQLTGHSTTGFPQTFKDEDFLESLPNRLKSVVERQVPLSLKGQNFALTFPVSRGMTNFKAIQMFEEALEDRDRDKMFQVAKAARENNLNPGVLINIAKRNVNKERRQQIMEDRQATRIEDLIGSLSGN